MGAEGRSTFSSPTAAPCSPSRMFQETETRTWDLFPTCQARWEMPVHHPISLIFGRPLIGSGLHTQPRDLGPGQPLGITSTQVKILGRDLQPKPP